MSASSSTREGSLEAPTRHPIDWQDPAFYDEALLNKELERVFDICHGCRRCVSLCNSFPTLFDLVDESDTMEVDGVDPADYIKVVDHCYLCDLCYLTKCPYVPPHEWNVDFPHLMLRAKAVKFQKGQTTFRDKMLSNTDMVGKLAGIPVVSAAVNASTQSKPMRALLEKTLKIHAGARLPNYHSKSGRKLLAHESVKSDSAQKKVALFVTCYGNYNEPQIVLDLCSILQHNRVEVTTVKKEQCCGMPKLELGDLDGVAKAKQANIPALIEMIDQGFDIVAPVPSCVLMFKQELPLMFPDDTQVQRVKQHIYDPFEYLMLLQKEQCLNTDFKNSLGHISYHASCHLRVQNMGLKTRDVLALVPDTKIDVIERCSGHDGTYAVKQEFHETAMKICRPVVKKVQQAKADYYSSDCPIAGHHIANGMQDDSDSVHPISLLRKAYGI